MPQDISLFHRSVMDNIRYGGRKRPTTKLLEAAIAARCDFIEAPAAGRAHHRRRPRRETVRRPAPAHRHRARFPGATPAASLDERPPRSTAIPQEVDPRALARLMPGAPWSRSRTGCPRAKFRRHRRAAAGEVVRRRAGLVDARDGLSPAGAARDGSAHQAGDVRSVGARRVRLSALSPSRRRPPRVDAGELGDGGVARV